MSKKVDSDNDLNLKFFTTKWGQDLFKHPNEIEIKEAREEETDSSIRWFKLFLKEKWLPKNLSKNLIFTHDGIISRNWQEKSNFSEKGFVIRYTIDPYLIQLEQIQSKVFIGIKTIKNDEQIRDAERVNLVIKIAKDVFQKGVLLSGGKELKKPHILEETKDLTWGWWSPAESQPLYDNNGAIVGYDLSGKSPNLVSFVMFQTDGRTVRYEITKLLPHSESELGIGKKSPDDYRNINELEVIEKKSATYIPYPSERFFETSWGRNLFDFPGEEVLKEESQSSIQEKLEIINEIKKFVRSQYLPSDLHEHLFYIENGVIEVDPLTNYFSEKDGFVSRYLIGSYLLQLEKTDSALFIGLKSVEINYAHELADRISMVRDIAEKILNEGVIQKRGIPIYIQVKKHRSDLTYGFWKTTADLYQEQKRIDFLTDGYSMRFEIRNVLSQFTQNRKRNT